MRACCQNRNILWHFRHHIPHQLLREHFATQVVVCHHVRVCPIVLIDVECCSGMAIGERSFRAHAHHFSDRFGTQSGFHEKLGSGDGGNCLVSVRLGFRRQRARYIEIPDATFDGGFPPMFHEQISLHKLDHQMEQLMKIEFLGVLERPHRGLHMEPICN